MSTTDRRGITVDGTPSTAASSTPHADLAIKAPCRVATTANITLSGLQTIDGISVAADDRVLVKDQSAATENGIYKASSGNWTRAVDVDGANEIVKGTIVLVNEGTVGAGTQFRCSATDPLTPGTSSLSFTSVTVSGTGFSTYLASPPAIGGTSAAAGAFTTLSASGLISANGGQIAFPASQNASAGANTLDDYEEGTWTPAYTYATPGNLTVAYSAQVGVYTKVGRLVVASFVVVTSTHTHTTASGNNQITGLPFTSANVSSQNAYGPMSWDGITKANYTQTVSRLVVNSAIVDFIASGSGQPAAAVAFGDCPTGTQQTRTGTLPYVV